MPNISKADRKRLERLRNERAVRLDMIDKMSDDCFLLFNEMNKMLWLVQTIKDDRRKKYHLTEKDKYKYARNWVLEFMEEMNKDVPEDEWGKNTKQFTVHDYRAYISPKWESHSWRKEKEVFTIEKS